MYELLATTLENAGKNAGENAGKSTGKDAARSAELVVSAAG